MKRCVFAGLMMLALAGCAAVATAPLDASAGKRIEGLTFTPGIADIAKKEGNVDLLEDERVRCEKHTPTGSHRVRYRCTTVVEKIASVEANARAMRKLQTPPPSIGANTIAGPGQ